MMIRRAAIQDLEQIMQIYARAVQYMHASGNPNQWVAGYPSRTLIEEDIARGVSYVVDRDSVIEAVFSYIEGEDPTYRQIGQGMWHTNGSYGTVHRLASAGRLRGVAGICFSWCAEQAKMHGCSSLRADTHQDNRIMQHLLQKNGFVYCGVIHLANGAPRLAFERAAVAPEGAYAGMPNPNGMNLGGAYAGTPNANGMNPGMPQQKQKGDGRGYGIASLILGIVSVLLFCTCINWVTAILAVIFGIIQITKNKEHGLAIGGIITAAVSMVLSVVLYTKISYTISTKTAMKVMEMMHGTAAVEMAAMTAAEAADCMTTAEMTDGMTTAEMTDGMTVMAVAATITIMIPTIISEIIMTFRSRVAISLCEHFLQWSDSFALFGIYSK